MLMKVYDLPDYILGYLGYEPHLSYIGYQPRLAAYIQDSGY